MTDVVNDVIINYKSENLDQTVDGIKRTSVALDGLVVASSSSEKATASLENRFKSLERQFATSEGNAARYAKIQETVNKAVGQNPELQGRANEILAQAAIKYQVATEGTIKAEGDLGKAHNTLSTQGMALAHAFRTGAEELALGVPITQVAAQQFSHLSYAATGPGGVVAAFKEVTGILGSGATFLAGLVTPAVAASTAMGIFATVGIAAGVHWGLAQKEVETALKGIGKQSGATASDINGIAEATAKSTNLTIGSAREMATVFAATGKIGKDNIELATKATDGLAHSLGVDGADAAKLLAAALSDPAKGLGELEAKTGAYDLKTQELVQSLVRQGELEKARTVLLQGVADATRNAAEANGFWAASFKAVKDGFDLVGKDVTQGFQLARHDLGGAGPTTGVSKQDQFATAQADLGSFAQKLPGNLAANAGDPQAIQAIYDAYGRLIDQVEKLKAAAREEALAPLTKSLKESATAADNAVNSYVPQIQKIRETEDAIHALTKAKQDAAIAGSQANAGADNAALIAAQNQLVILQQSVAAAQQYNLYVREIAGSYKNVSTQTALQLSSMDDQLRILKARTDYEKQSAQYAKDYNAARASGKTDEDALEIASKQAAINHERARDAAIAARDATLQWQQNMLGVGSAAKAAADAMDAANESRFQSASVTPGMVGGGDSGGYASTSNFGNFNVAKGQQYTSTTAEGLKNLIIQAAFDKAKQQRDAVYASIKTNYSATDVANSNIGGGIDSAIGSVSRLGASDDSRGVLRSLYDLKNSQTSDKSAQVANLQSFMATLQSQPETIARDQQIVQLYQSIKQLKEATDANTAATQATLNPLYSQGHGALAIGYYKAANGLDGVVQGSGGVDSVPVHIMMTPGEPIKAGPAAVAANSNNNSRTVVNNNSFLFPGIKTNSARRNGRQLAQGFSQIMAAGS